MSDRLRIVIAEDDVLFREGIARLLTDAGFDVVGRAGDAEDLVRKVLAHHPDVAVVDIQMPPGRGADGMRAALELRARLPKTGVLVLSGHYEETYAAELLRESAEGVGYLLKERVAEVETFTDAVSRVAAGGTALDPEVVGRMLGRRGNRGGLAELTDREREVLAQLAEGKSNLGIAETLLISTAAVEKHITSIFQKLGIQSTPKDHRRVLAAVTYLKDPSS